jgi:hypothetical protein
LQHSNQQMHVLRQLQLSHNKPPLHLPHSKPLLHVFQQLHWFLPLL